MAGPLDMRYLVHNFIRIIFVDLRLIVPEFLLFFFLVRNLF
jgi:hypothetical protein